MCAQMCACKLRVPNQQSLCRHCCLQKCDLELKHRGDAIADVQNGLANASDKARPSLRLNGPRSWRVLVRRGGQFACLKVNGLQSIRIVALSPLTPYGVNGLSPAPPPPSLPVVKVVILRLISFQPRFRRRSTYSSWSALRR